MSSTTLRTIIAIVIFVHGIGHFQGLVPSLGIFSTDKWNSQSWLLTNWLGESASRIIAIILFGVCFLGFIAAGLSFLNVVVPHALWRTLSVIFMVPSLLAVILYWNSLAMFFNKAGALGVNIAIIIGLLILNWPSEADIGF